VQCKRLGRPSPADRLFYIFIDETSSTPPSANGPEARRGAPLGVPVQTRWLSIVYASRLHRQRRWVSCTCLFCTLINTWLTQGIISVTSRYDTLLFVVHHTGMQRIRLQHTITHCYSITHHTIWYNFLFCIERWHVLYEFAWILNSFSFRVSFGWYCNIAFVCRIEKQNKFSATIWILMEAILCNETTTVL
jgi:transposase